jgi:hypothetical protein
MSSSEARRKWNEAHYAQIKVSVDKSLAASFKAGCAARGETVAGVLAAFMRSRVGVSAGGPCLPADSAPSTRGKRRGRAGAILAELERIFDDEEVYLDNIPENMRGGQRADAAAHSLAMLADAIEALRDAY